MITVPAQGCSHGAGMVDDASDNPSAEHAQGHGDPTMVKRESVPTPEHGTPGLSLNQMYLHNDIWRFFAGGFGNRGKG